MELKKNMINRLKLVAGFSIFLVFYSILYLHYYSDDYIIQRAGLVGDYGDADAFNNRLLRLKDLNQSQYKCLATGGRSAYCQATNVCLSADHGLFLVVDDENFKSSGPSFEESQVKSVDDISRQHDWNMANLRMADWGDSLFFHPARMRVGADTRYSNLKAVYHTNETLVVGAGFSTEHLTHLLYNLILPLYEIIYGDAIERMALFDLAFKSLEDRLGKTLVGQEMENFAQLDISNFSADPFFFTAKHFEYYKPTVLVYSATEQLAIDTNLLFDRLYISRRHEMQPEKVFWFSSYFNWISYFSEGYRKNVDGIHCYPRASFGLASCGGGCPAKIQRKSINVFKKRIHGIFSEQFSDINTVEKEVEFLGQTLLRNQMVKSPQYTTGPNVINITIIQRPKKRTIRNIDTVFNEIQNFLQKNTTNQTAFRIRLVQFDSADYKHQVYIASNSHLLITVHGNAMGNLLYLPYERTRVATLEIKPPEFNVTFFEESIAAWFPPEKFWYKSYLCQKEDRCLIKSEKDRVQSVRDRHFNIEWLSFGPLFAEALQFIVG